MRHFVQGHNECFPTCLGIYLEKDPKQVIKEILGVEKVGETTWSERVGYSTTKEDLVEIRLRLERYLPNIIPWLTVDSFLISRIEFLKRYLYGIPYWPSDLPPTKGFITMNFWHPDIMFGVLPARHIIAFEGETIFDPSKEAPVSYKEFRKMVELRTFPDTLYCPEGRFML